MFNIDLDELERLAKAATPGPWKQVELGRRGNSEMECLKESGRRGYYD